MSTVNVKMRKLADLLVKWIFYDQTTLLSYLFIVLSIAAAHLVPPYEVLHQCAWAWSDVFSYMVCWWLFLLAYSYSNQWKLMKELKSWMSYVIPRHHGYEWGTCEAACNNIWLYYTLHHALLLPGWCIFHGLLSVEILHCYIYHSATSSVDSILPALDWSIDNLKL